jgi:hypothetical protein
MGWRGAFVAIRQQWFLFLAVAIGLVVWNAVLTRVWLVPPGAHPLDVDNLVRDAMNYIIDSVLAVPCLLAVHRSILLKDDGAGWQNWRRLMMSHNESGRHGAGIPPHESDHGCI